MKFLPPTERPPHFAEVGVDSSPFDFDVVTGPPLPPDKGKPNPSKDGGEKPSAGAAEGGHGKLASGT